MLSHKKIKIAGFTLIELLIVIAVIGILSAVAVPLFDQYRTRGYDAHSKQALRDMSLLCNAYWLDTDCTQTCDITKIKNATYGFKQNDKLMATMPASPCASFCASAKHTSSPNTYSINDKSVLSTGAGCQNQAQPPQVVLTESEQIEYISEAHKITVQKFDSNCQLLQETAKQCSSQSGPLSHVDDEDREWTMDCPVTDPREARDYYYRLLSGNALTGGKDSNPYYDPNPEWTPNDPNANGHNKLCCYSSGPNDSNYMDFSLERREEKIQLGHWNDRKTAPVYSGICGLSAKGASGDNDPYAGGRFNRSVHQRGQRVMAANYASGNLRMLCNMGGEDGQTQFSSCDFNVLSGESPQPQ